jgi:hypothetical protein
MLDDRQKNAVRKWAADGAGLSEIQRRIKDEFGISMTYMDVRFLMLDIDAVVKDKPEPKTPPPAPSAASADAGEAPRQDGEGALDDNLADGAAPAAGEEGYTPPGMDGDVKVELDRVVRAGALASGSVTFSDGVTGSWYLDRMGRLGLTKVSKPDYQPSREDLEAFQMALQDKLAQGGY